MKSMIVLAITFIAFSTACRKDRQPESVKKPIVTTIAGTGDRSYLNGPAMSAKFYDPTDVAVLSDGTIYVSDATNNRIRKISGGQVTNFAGSSYSGTTNAQGEDARFKTPGMLALDALNNAYILENNNPQVRRMSPDANVTLYAGIGIIGYADGSVATAKFGQNLGILVDPEGNVIVSDTYNNRIRKISTNGQVTTIAGSGAKGYVDGNGPIAQFDQPRGIAMDKEGSIYIADANNHRIRKLSPDGKVSTFAGSGIDGWLDGPMGLAQFHYTVDMVIDKDGNLIVTDTHSIRKINPHGDVSTMLGPEGGFADGDSATAKFYAPAGLAIDAAGNIYVADQGNNRIRKISFVPVN